MTEPEGLSDRELTCRFCEGPAKATDAVSEENGGGLVCDKCIDDLRADFQLRQRADALRSKGDKDDPLVRWADNTPPRWERVST